MMIGMGRERLRPGSTVTHVHLAWEQGGAVAIVPIAGIKS